jgi:hypothetical protein
MAVGAGLLLMSGLETGSKWTHLLPGFVVAGIGMGFAAPTLANAAVEVVDPQRSGMAAGINNTFRQLGTATGIAGLGVVFHSVVKDRISEALGPAAAHGPGAGALADAVASGGTRAAAGASPPPLRSAVAHAGATGFIDGMNQILLVAGIVGLAGGALALVLVRSRDFVTSDIPRAERSSAFNSVPIAVLPPLPEEISVRPRELLHPAVR